MSLNPPTESSDVTHTCFFGPDRPGRCTRVACTDGVGGHDPELVFHPGVELHCHGGLHVSGHRVWICKEHEAFRNPTAFRITCDPLTDRTAFISIDTSPITPEPRRLITHAFYLPSSSSAFFIPPPSLHRSAVPLNSVTSNTLIIIFISDILESTCFSKVYTSVFPTNHG